jgi:hypothetical protein
VTSNSGDYLRHGPLDSMTFKQTIRDGVADLLAEVAAGEISADDAERELDIDKALCELIAMAAEMSWPVPAEERMRRDEKLMALWPEACRRAGVAVSDMPTDIIRAVAALKGRPS